MPDTSSKPSGAAAAKGASPRHATKPAAKHVPASSKSASTASKPAAPRRRARKNPAHGKATRGKWSNAVTQQSDALDLESAVFKSKDPTRVAKSLKSSAEKSKRRKGSPLQSAMSMLNFYINRAGKNLPKDQKSVLQKAKVRLRQLFGRPAA
ncbi:MAG: DUF3175 domain-containing protein [Janthinobacterium lividum]